ncbi:MAG: MFS transporter [Clostridium sp.]|uniref:MFS transporter n=1 Tax=Clostridium sp. TaxID=1506 RepID=UPI002A812206|nr:MFS transporter [Clostridium sp.]MCI6691629.1 MFS transporter [Clostridium sp.]MDY4253175.1 MFS transporter [Clostridium sp.]
MGEIKLEKKQSKYGDLFYEKNYVLDTFASIISRFGDGIDTIAFSLLVYKITGSTLLVATIFAVNGLPNLIFGMVSGVACKYVSDKKIMAICDFGRAVCVFLIAILFITNNLAVWHLYLITFLNSSFESFRQPASMSIVPKTIPMEKLDHAMAFSSSSCKISELLGLAIAPLIISLFGLGGAIIIDALTFLICGILIICLKIKNTVSDEKITVKGSLNDLKEGFVFIKKDNLIITIVLFAAIINALLVPINSLQAPYVEKVLGTGSTTLSVISIGLLIGMILAGLFGPRIKEILGGRNMFIIGGVIIGITYILLSLISNIENKQFIYISLAIIVFLLGVGILLLTFVLQVIMIKKVKQEFLSRVASIFNAGALCAVPISACIVGIISQFINIKILFLGFGILVSLLFLIMFLNKNIKKFNEY